MALCRCRLGTLFTGKTCKNFQVTFAFFFLFYNFRSQCLHANIFSLELNKKCIWQVNMLMTTWPFDNNPSISATCWWHERKSHPSVIRLRQAMNACTTFPANPQLLTKKWPLMCRSPWEWWQSNWYLVVELELGLHLDHACHHDTLISHLLRPLAELHASGWYYCTLTGCEWNKCNTCTKPCTKTHIGEASDVQSWYCVREVLIWLVIIVLCFCCTGLH